MKKTSILILSCAVFIVSGCAKNIPECGSEESIRVLKEVIADSLTKKGDSAKITVSSIETKSKDEKLKRNTCAAEVTWTLSPDVGKVLTDLDKVQGFAALTNLATGGGNAFAALGQISNAKEIDPETAQRLYELWAGFVSSANATDEIKLTTLQEKEQAPLLLGPAYTAVSKIVNNYPAKFENGVIHLTPKKLSYVVRANEDKKGGDFFVETTVPTVAIQIITELESLPEYVKQGKIFLDKNKTKK